MPDFTPWPEQEAARYRALGYWRGQTFGAWLRELAGKHGPRVAVVAGDRGLTYTELDHAADRLAAGLSGLGLRRGDRVVVQLPNDIVFLEAVFALFRLGVLPVFALPAHRETEIAHLVEHSDATAYLTTRELEVPSKARVLHADALPYGDPGTQDGPQPGDVAFLQLSGGSTGLPKLIPRTHDDYLYSVRASAGICGLDTGTVYLCALPAAHNFPLSSPGVLGVLHAGGRVVMAPRPTPDVAFPLIERERVTVTALVPPLALVWLRAAARTSHDLSSLRLLQVGGAKLAAETARQVRPVLGCRLQQVFGMAEGLVNYTRADDPDDIVETTQGRPISPHDELLVVDPAGRPVAPGDVGELLTRGPYTIRGYYRDADPAAFTEDGYYRTGDLVRLTPSGHLVVEGRAKDLINRGGEKVSPEEVESHLLEHPAVLDAAVVEVPDAYLGERTCAFVVPNGPPPSAAEIRSFVRSRGLAEYKVPDRVEIVAAFPSTGVGKTSKRELRAALRAAVRGGQ
ncbi:2,3-dihydroxybenzoate-AMP ligase [Streptosporangium becharense]|uniref:2,3-dihydroxybenzoate-AMP ligase n=1 Tax=Streptosporangium becharense TaxID=1816182 RepID=A0A7W9IBR4_9ACTN|nr:AMP-binding protein [Streptosporangium becharense]MBB2910630.1 2,3-dihydroxybenzoate-AMP ligase [Streptosporangium becharense]MBB5817326.1 2,3-dihydroxybenzoate-AMP ligase [Streptosporangium becharense]